MNLNRLIAGWTHPRTTALKAVMRKLEKGLPSISPTERTALNAGKPWVDKPIFNGRADFAAMLNERFHGLTAEEREFIEGPVRKLCRMVDPWKVSETHRVDEEVIKFIRDNGFMGLHVPTEYGGKGFSRLAISRIMQELASWSFPMAVYVIIPNSLGAAELILHYGTPEQRRELLPRLAAGEWIPAFGLTEPRFGSNAMEIEADAEVFVVDGETKLRLNFRKRYITMAPEADIITLACQVRDPLNILGKGKKPGLTCVLIFDGTPGFTHGDHFKPIGDRFLNGPLYGKDVVVPIDNVIGGADGVGMGAKMLFEQLAGGRAISLPAGALANTKWAAAVVGAYGMVRTQFGIQIGRMGSNEESIGKIAAIAYAVDAAVRYTCSAIDRGDSPPVVSAILKWKATELGEQALSEGMDTLAGAGVCEGPNNALALKHKSAKVGITVEGANRLNGDLAVMGQGGTRNHDFAQAIIDALEDDDVETFVENMRGWIAHAGGNLGRSILHSATRGTFVGVPECVDRQTVDLFKRLGWAISQFGLFTDLALLLIGGKLKSKGKISRRYAEAAANMVLAISTLARFEDEGCLSEDLPLVRYFVEYALAETQKAFEGIFRNANMPVIGGLMKTVGLFMLRLNPLSLGPTDEDGHAAALTIQTYGPQYFRLIEGIHVPSEDQPGLGRLLKAFRLVTETSDIFKKIVEGQKRKLLPIGGIDEEMIDLAKAVKLVSAAEAKALRKALAKILEQSPNIERGPLAGIDEQLENVEQVAAAVGIITVAEAKLFIKLFKAQSPQFLPRGEISFKIIDMAHRAEIISDDEAQAVRVALAARLAAIEVDEFSPASYYERATEPVALAS